MFEVKVGRMLYNTLQIWNSMSAEECVMLERHGILISSCKFQKANSAFNGYASSVTVTTKASNGTVVPGTPVKNGTKFTGAFAIQSKFSPEPGAGLSNSQIERVKDEEIFEQYRDRN